MKIDYMLYFWHIIFFLTAFFYSAAGLGGASAYLAYFSLMEIEYNLIPSSALTLSILSTITSTINWWRAGYMRKIIIPIVLVSSPPAFIGGRIKINENLFSIILISILLAVGVIMLVPKWGKKTSIGKAWRYTILFSSSAILGFLGGAIGIGCGVFLVPIVYFLGFLDEKESASAGSFFILINSIFGLVGHISKLSFDLTFALSFAIPVAAGAFLGSTISAKKIPPNAVKKIFASVIISIAVIKAVMMFKAN